MLSVKNLSSVVEEEVFEMLELLESDTELVEDEKLRLDLEDLLELLLEEFVLDVSEDVLLPSLVLELDVLELEEVDFSR